jgi:hypothetical protein
MCTEQIIQKWEEKQSSILSEYSRGSANNEVMQLYRSQMKNILDFIKDIKQVENNFALADVSGRSEQLKAYREWLFSLSQEEHVWYEGRYEEVFLSF